MRPLTSMFSASVARRCQVVKKTCVGARAAHGRRDGVGVLEVGGQRRDARVEPLGAAAQTCDLPAIGEQALREVAAADAGGADDECAPAHARPFGTKFSALASRPG